MIGFIHFGIIARLHRIIKRFYQNDIYFCMNDDFCRCFNRNYVKIDSRIWKPLPGAGKGSAVLRGYGELLDDLQRTFQDIE